MNPDLTAVYTEIAFWGFPFLIAKVVLLLICLERREPTDLLDELDRAHVERDEARMEARTAREWHTADLTDLPETHHGDQR